MDKKEIDTINERLEWLHMPPLREDSLNLDIIGELLDKVEQGIKGLVKIKESRNAVNYTTARLHLSKIDYERFGL